MPGLRLLRISALLLSAVSPALAGQTRCAGDCDRNGIVPVSEVVLCVQIPLGRVALEDCPNADRAGDGNVGIDDLIAAVDASLSTCPAGEPTATSSVSPQASSTPTTTSTPSATPTMESSTTATPTSTPTASPTPTLGVTPTIPTGGAALVEWLAAGNYLGWAAEGSIHTANSPHPSRVRVFVNDLLLESLEEGRTQHPAGAAAVKEIYGATSNLRGWAVTVKLQDDAENGQGWYWFERIGTSVFADGPGAVGCTGCHSLGTDYFRTPFPLSP